MIDQGHLVVELVATRHPELQELKAYGRVLIDAMAAGSTFASIVPQLR
jgi:hypothetical protein